MPKVPVDPPGDEHVPLLLPALYQMAEVGSRVHHGRRPRALTDDQHGRPEAQPRRVQRGRKHVPRVSGEEAVVRKGFGKGHAVRNVVRSAVAGQEEGGQGRGGRVGDGGGVELEEVEEGEEEEEGGEAPRGRCCWWGGGVSVGVVVGAVRERGEVEGREQGGGERGAEGEGAEGDGGGVSVGGGRGGGGGGGG